jgi:hypothetical protein
MDSKGGVRHRRPASTNKPASGVGAEDTASKARQGMEGAFGGDFGNQR